MPTIKNPQILLEGAKYIASSLDLDVAISDMTSARLLSIDTEFIRERTYYPQLCLIQVATQSQAWCLDAIAVEDISAFFKLCDDESITKVLHSARQDMEIFCLRSGGIPMPIFDTQLAATFTGRADQISYAGLVEDIFDVQLDKSQSRTNWVKRPLSAEQIIYALNDVVYLEELYERLVEELREKGRAEWFAEDSSALGNHEIYMVTPEDAWQKVKGGGHLNEQAFKWMMALAGWREKIAQTNDLPRSWVVKDPALIHMAENPHGDLRIYEDNSVLTSKQIKVWGADLREVFSQDHQTRSLPSFHGTRGLSADQKKLLKAVTACVKLAATELDVQPSLLANRKQLERIVRGSEDVPVFKGWRAEAAGEKIRGVLDQQWVNA